MERIQIKYSFQARKPCIEEDFEKKLATHNQTSGYYIDYCAQDVIYCEHCRIMDYMYKFYVLRKGTIDEAIIKKCLPINYNTSTYGDVIRFIAESSQKTIERVLKNKLTKEELAKILEMKFAKTDQGKHPMLICPNCGKKIKHSNLKFLTKVSSWMADNAFVHAYEIKEEDDDKFVLSIFQYSIFPVVEAGKLKYIETNVRFVFNKKTKNIYAMQPITAMKMKPLYKDTKRIINITYMANSTNFLTTLQTHAIHNNNVLNYLADYICSLNGDKKEDVLPQEFSPAELFYYFRYPKLSIEARDNIQDICAYQRLKNASRQRRKLMLQQVYLMQDSPDVVLYEMKRKKCPDKKRLKKMIMANPFCIYLYRFLTKLGFKDYNVIMDILSEMTHFYGRLINASAGLLPYEDDSRLLKQYIKAFVKAKGDVRTKKLLFNVLLIEEQDMWSLLLDCSRLYDEILQCLEGDLFPLTFCDIRKMHDDMSRILPRLRHKNRKIPYERNDMKLNMDIGEIQFRLSPDTNHLVDCGEKMGICVGGYGNMATKRACIIVFMLEKGSYVGCIELSPDLSKLRQAKSKFNGTIQGNRALALKKWVDINKIDGEKCIDYRHILENKITFDKKCDGFYNFSVTTQYSDPDRINKNVTIDTQYLIKNDDTYQIEEIKEPQLEEETIFEAEWRFLENQNNENE